MKHIDSRTLAHDILNGLDQGNQTLDGLLEKATENVNFPYQKDRSVLQAITFGVLRWRKRLDWTIARFSNTPFENIDPTVLNILRVGLFQIKFMDRIPVSAAVNTSVELAKTSEPAWVVKFVNALLRSAASSNDGADFPAPEHGLVESMSVEKSFPEPLIKRWLERFGEKETRELCDASNRIAPITVRMNSLRTTREKILKSLDGETGRAWPARISPDGIVFSNPKKPIFELTAFRLGWFQVQDEAAQLAASLLDPQPAETVLDACAGLGGKTGQIAQTMKNRGRIVAMDNNRTKLQKLAKDMDRQIFTNVTTHVHDLDEPLKGRPFRQYDRIFLDAPCSGSGVLRRNPDGKWRVDWENLKTYHVRQNKFLENLAPALKPGGVLVYCVCSMEPEETDEVADNFLINHREFSIRKPPQELVDKEPSLFTDRGFFRSYPHRHEMDGFFAAGFVKKK